MGVRLLGVIGGLVLAGARPQAKGGLGLAPRRLWATAGPSTAVGASRQPSLRTTFVYFLWIGGGMGGRRALSRSRKRCSFEKLSYLRFSVVAGQNLNESWLN